MLKGRSYWAVDNFGRLGKQFKAAGPAGRHKAAAETHKDWAGDVRRDTGQYALSIGVDPDVGNTTSVSSKDDLQKALANEFGTHKMSARPSATQAAMRHGATLVEATKAAAFK